MKVRVLLPIPHSAMGKYAKINPPKRGSKITVAKNGQLQVPDDPIVPFIQHEGIAANVWKACQTVFETAVDGCYGNAKRLEWLEIYAGDRGIEVYGPSNHLPEDSVRAIQEYKVCLKGPLAAPPGTTKPLDASLRERLDLFARVQPVRYLHGVPSPLNEPKGLDLVIFREHTEDIYSEIEWKKGSPEAKQIINFINNEMNKKPVRSIRPDSSIGIKPISATATKRVMRLAIDYAIKHKRRSVTFVHKGNQMRLTEGFFRDWGYELARKEFNEYVVTEHEIEEEHGGQAPRSRVVVRDRIADEVFRELLVAPDTYDVIATTNLNGDFVSNLALGMAGDGGIAPTAYIGAKAALFEATRSVATEGGSEEDLNPSSVLLAGVMLFEHLGWKDAADLIVNSLAQTIGNGTITCDLARHVEGAQILKTTEFCDTVIDNFEEVRRSRVREAMNRPATHM